MENTMKHDFDDLYRGAAEDFDEKQYLTALSKVRYEVHKSLADNDILFGGGDQCIADMGTRIDKNGGMAIEFQAGTPINIVTPYGAFPVRSTMTKDCKLEKEQKCFQELDALFGLTPVAGNSNLMAITKLPWQEKAKEAAEKTAETAKEETPAEVETVKPAKQSLFSRILPWRRKKVAEPEIKEEPEVLEELEAVDEPETVPGVNLRTPSKIYYVNDYTDEGDYLDDVAMKGYRETKHLNQLLAEINAEFMESGHPEYMLPGDGVSDKITYTLNGKDYVVKGLNRINREQGNDGAKKFLARSAEKEKQAAATAQTDLGREM